MSQPASAPRIPSLRFPEFSGEWEEFKLGCFCTVGDIDHKIPVFQPVGIPYVRIENFFGVNGIDYEKSKKISVDSFNQLSKKIKPELGDILIARYASIGALRYIETDIDFLASYSCAIIKTAKPESSKFLYYCLQSNSVQSKIASKTNFGAQKNIGIKLLRELNVFKPALAEQKAVASFFSSIDLKIEQLMQKKSLLERYKAGVMQQVFSRKIRFRDNNGSSYPDWENKKLKTLGLAYNGLSRKKYHDFGKGLPYIQYNQVVRKSKINTSGFGLVSVSDDEKQNKVSYGDVFFTVSSATPSEAGETSILLKKVGCLYLNSFCFGFRPNNLIFNCEFSNYLFKTKCFRKKIMPLVQGSTRYNIHKKKVMDISVLLPSIEEQVKIAALISAIDRKIELLEKQLVMVNFFKKRLIYLMFFNR